MVVGDDVYGGDRVVFSDDETDDLLHNRHYHQHYECRTQKQFELVMHYVPNFNTSFICLMNNRRASTISMQGRIARKVVTIRPKG